MMKTESTIRAKKTSIILTMLLIEKSLHKDNFLLSCCERRAQIDYYTQITQLYWVLCESVPPQLLEFTRD